MGRRTVHLSLDLEVDGGSLSGYVVSGAGERRAIWGRLGLLGAIERLIGEDPNSPEEVPEAVFGEPFHRPAAARRWFTSLGCRCSLLVSGAESGGSYLVVEVDMPPGPRPPARVHGNEDLTVLLLDGEARFQLGREAGRMGPGDLVNVPRGTPHAIWNEGPAPAKLILSAIPAGLEGLIAEASPSGLALTSTEEAFAPCEHTAARYGIRYQEGTPGAEPGRGKP